MIEISNGEFVFLLLFIAILFFYLISTLDIVVLYFCDKYVVKKQSRNFKKRFEFSPQILDYNSYLFYIGSRDENFYRRFVEWENRSLRLEKLLDQVVDYINDNECSVKDDE